MNSDDVMMIAGAELMARRAALVPNGRLVHYTSADAAHKIISGAQVWLRSASVMNDFSEISHGLNCLHKAWASPGGIALQEMLDRLQEGLRDDLANLFDGHARSFRTDTYLISLSEHDDREDELGRLSMWRAYGGVTGVALVLNITAFASSTDAMKAFSAPVSYESESSFVEYFQKWAGRLLANEVGFRQVSPEVIRNSLFYMFRIFAMCTKHPAFAEEREWRVFHSPLHEGSSPWLEYAVETVNGVPQPLVKLKMFDDKEVGVEGVAPASLINRVIIGPCEHPLQVRSAMHQALEKVGVRDIESKLWMSLIPLRQN